MWAHAQAGGLRVRTRRSSSQRLVRSAMGRGGARGSHDEIRRARREGKESGYRDAWRLRERARWGLGRLAAAVASVISWRAAASARCQAARAIP
eukprot:8187720-Pyramimonas_sp.AAC.1